MEYFFLIWLHRVLVVARRIFVAAYRIFTVLFNFTFYTIFKGYTPFTVITKYWL